MTFARARAALRAFLCLILIAATSPVATVAPAYAGPATLGHAIVAQEKDETCGRGKATKEFGWKVVSFGVDTLKYLIGLFIIPIGLFLVVVGWLLQMVEAVAC